jgi:hypothetical protein
MRTIKGLIAIAACFVAFGIVTMVLFEATFIYYEVYILTIRLNMRCHAG